MKLVPVELASYAVTDDPRVHLVVRDVSASVVMTLYDPKRQVGAVLHYMLPTSDIARTQAENWPGMFADTGIPLVFKEAFKFGCIKSDLIVRIVGGGDVYGPDEICCIGRKNQDVLRRILFLANVPIMGEDLGGKDVRTVWLSVSTGRVYVTTPADTRELHWFN